MIAVGDVVRLIAEGGEEFPMLVVGIYPNCDGTSGDGAGLLCVWQHEDDFRPSRGVVSESSVFKPIGVKWGVRWNGCPIGFSRLERLFS